MILMPMSTPLTSAEGTHLQRGDYTRPTKTNGWSPKNDGVKNFHLVIQFVTFLGWLSEPLKG